MKAREVNANHKIALIYFLRLIFCFMEMGFAEELYASIHYNQFRPFSRSSKTLSLLINQSHIYLKQRPLDILSASAECRSENVWKTVSFDFRLWRNTSVKVLKEMQQITRMTKNMMWSNESASFHRSKQFAAARKSYTTDRVNMTSMQAHWMIHNDDRLSFVNVIFSWNFFFYVDRFVYLHRKKECTIQKKKKKSFNK